MVTVPHVYILPWCGDPAAVYGSVLTFKTLRVGFPTAAVTVIDNASAPAARPEIRAAAESCGARFIQLDRQVAHEDFIADVILRHPSGPVAILDPDLCFWRNVENWSFGDALVAGRLIPEYRCEYARAVTHARLHTSFLWVPDIDRLRATVLPIAQERREWRPISPSMFMLNGEWHRYDTAASLYAVLGDKARAFTAAELDSYDHLFVGSHLSVVGPTLAPDDFAHLASVHGSVKAGNVEALRGEWKRQQTFFEQRGTP